MFQIAKAPGSSPARTGELVTGHGRVRTPAFVGVATRASIKGVEPTALTEIGLEMVISNTYHLHLRPGEDVVQAVGGIHRFSGWTGPTMTDSGGFQVFSLGAGKEHGVGKVASIFPGEETSGTPNKTKSGSRLVRLSELGASFRSVIDGSSHMFTPESVITIQRKLGADVILPLDECTSPLHDRAYTQAAMERTHRWARRGLEAFRLLADDRTFPNPKQELYGIVQGGAFEELRRQSADIIGEMGFDGFAVGGSLGRSKAEMWNVLDWTIPALPAAKPRHLLGIGELEDIFAAAYRGIDTFDCAAPTRMARNGSVYFRGEPRHRINLRNARFRTDDRPIDPGCDCPACRTHSRAYLQHLCRAGELSYYRLATLHNLRFLVQLMSDIRGAIAEDRLVSLARDWGYRIS